MLGIHFRMHYHIKKFRAIINQMYNKLFIPLQVAEMLITSLTATVAFDATTLSGEHINAVHFCTVENTLTASVVNVPGGTAQDYATHICNVIDDCSNTDQ